MAYSSQFQGYGSGKDGSLSYAGGDLSGTKGIGLASFSGTSGNNYGTFTDNVSFNGTDGGRIGDFVLIHNAYSGVHEIAKIINRSGTTVYFNRKLSNTYGTGTQLVSSGQYTNITLNGTTTLLKSYNYDGNRVGGIMFLVCNGTFAAKATVSASGVNGVNFGSGSDGVYWGTYTVGGGFRGGPGRRGTDSNQGALQGEGSYGDGGESTAANGNGGGGGKTLTMPSRAGGGGGGNGAVGQAGYQEGTLSNATPGAGGGTFDNATLSTMWMGGGGGGAFVPYSYSGVSGASGGGIIYIIAKKIDLSDSSAMLALYGGTGAREGQTGSGSGAGGSCLLKGYDINIGTDKINVAGGISSGGDQYGGYGGVGRIRAEYASSFTGSATGLSSAQNTNLYESKGGVLFFANIL